MTAKKTGNSISRSIKINNPKKIKIACVISEWHIEITESFYSGALKKISEYGIPEENIDKIYVPGSFELIFATKNLINKDYDAIISMGCIIKGETKHFDFISESIFFEEIKYIIYYLFSKFKGAICRIINIIITHCNKPVLRVHNDRHDSKGVQS